MPQSIRSDERLAERASAGDRRALTAIFKRYHQDLYRYCAALLGNSEDAADALQNTMVKVLGALPGERRRLHLKPWLYRIAHNESIELLRKRQDLDPIDPEVLVGAHGPEARAETRERLRQLVADLRELPERQRGSLVMRELGGLSFEQIGSAFETSAAVARQTVYEARIGLQEMERGRAMRCDEVRRKLSDGDRRVIRRRDVRAHLRGCSACREFEGAISDRRADLAAISPLPALVAAGLLKGALGGAAGSAGGVAAGAGAAGGAISTSAAMKAVATLAVAGAVGVGAADRTGLVQVFRGADRAEAPASAGGDVSTPGIAAPVERPSAAGKASGAPVGHRGVSSVRRASAPPLSTGKEAGAPGLGSEGAPGAAHPRGRGSSFAGAGRGHGKASGKGAAPANGHGGNPHANGGNRGEAASHAQGGAGSQKNGGNGSVKALHDPAPGSESQPPAKRPPPPPQPPQPEAVQPPAHGKPEG